MGAPAPAEDLPFRFFPAREETLVLDMNRIGTARRHSPQHPFGEGAAADQNRLPASRIMAQHVEEALQTGAVGTDGLLAEFLDILSVLLRLDLVHHRPLRLSPLRQRVSGTGGHLLRIPPASWCAIIRLFESPAVIAFAASNPRAASAVIRQARIGALHGLLQLDSAFDRVHGWRIRSRPHRP